MTAKQMQALWDALTETRSNSRESRRIAPSEHKLIPYVQKGLLRIFTGSLPFNGWVGW